MSHNIGDDQSLGQEQSDKGIELIDLEVDLERRLEEEGYKLGYEKGQKDGKEDAYTQGLIEGAKRGSEVGQYGGVAMTWIQLLKLNHPQENQQDHQFNETTISTSKQSLKILNKLQELLELVENFPKQNETFCEDKLNLLRVKFKQATSMLNIKLT